MATFNQIKTASALKGFVENGGSNFFDCDSMRFFGDSMSNYGIRHMGLINGAWTVELYRRKPVKMGLKDSAYFAQASIDTAKRVRI